MSQLLKTFESDSNIVACYGDFRYRILQPHEKPLLQRIHQLVAANLIASGDVTVVNAMAAAADNEFDNHPDTIIVVIEDKSGRLAGTYSFTKATLERAPINRHFNQELALVPEGRSWTNGWRFSMSPLFQGPLLRLQTLKVVWLVCLKQQVDDFVLYFNERLLAYYQRLLIGEEVARATITFDGSALLPVIAMRCPVIENLEKNNLITKGEGNELAMVG